MLAGARRKAYLLRPVLWRLQRRSHVRLPDALLSATRISDPRLFDVSGFDAWGFDAWGFDVWPWRLDAYSGVCHSDAPDTAAENRSRLPMSFLS